MNVAGFATGHTFVSLSLIGNPIVYSHHELQNFAVSVFAIQIALLIIVSIVGVISRRKVNDFLIGWTFLHLHSSSATAALFSFLASS